MGPDGSMHGDEGKKKKIHPRKRRDDDALPTYGKEIADSR